MKEILNYTYEIVIGVAILTWVVIQLYKWLKSEWQDEDH